MMLNKIIFLTIFTILAVVFYRNGNIDLAVSGYFYDHLHGFYLKESLFAKFTHKVVPLIVGIFITGAVILGTRKLLKVKSVNPKHYIKIIYVMLVCITGPGIVVNMVFKENFGRARPIQVENFGGTAKFTPAFVIANQCNTNCSFVSGHASIGFVFFAFAFINKGRKRMMYNVLAISLGSIFGLGRIIQGAHFLSDVIFSGFFVYITAYVLALLILPKEETTTST
ncbi:hypothetical protein I862_00240 [endosymbiont of Acanthamoeba sp. UWC8]|nr:hypothetical protein I862_00240 [endosymbiont of Acanthamoeba sp. UWC8]